MVVPPPYRAPLDSLTDLRDALQDLPVRATLALATRASSERDGVSADDSVPVYVDDAAVALTPVGGASALARTGASAVKVPADDAALTVPFRRVGPHGFREEGSAVANRDLAEELSLARRELAARESGGPTASRSADEKTTGPAPARTPSSSAPARTSPFPAPLSQPGAPILGTESRMAIFLESARPRKSRWRTIAASLVFVTLLVAVTAFFVGRTRRPWEQARSVAAAVLRKAKRAVAPHSSEGSTPVVTSPFSPALPATSSPTGDVPRSSSGVGAGPSPSAAPSSGASWQEGAPSAVVEIPTTDISLLPRARSSQASSTESRRTKRVADAPSQEEDEEEETPTPAVEPLPQGVEPLIGPSLEPAPERTKAR